MSINVFINAPKIHVAAQEPNDQDGDAESLLEMMLNVCFCRKLGWVQIPVVITMVQVAGI